MGAVWELGDQAPVLPGGGSKGPDWPPLLSSTWPSASCLPAGGWGEDLGNSAGVSKEESSVCISAQPQGKERMSNGRMY